MLSWYFSWRGESLGFALKTQHYHLKNHLRSWKGNEPLTYIQEWIKWKFWLSKEIKKDWQNLVRMCLFIRGFHKRYNILNVVHVVFSHCVALQSYSSVMHNWKVEQMHYLWELCSLFSSLSCLSLLYVYI